jgi:hypothetical protein
MARRGPPAALVLLALAAPAAAQERTQALRAIRSSASLSDATVAGYQLALEGSIAEKVATASAAWTRRDGRETLEVKLSGPFDEGAAEVQPFTLEGFTDSASAKLVYSRFIWRKETRRDAGGRPLQDLACRLVGKAAEDCQLDDFLENGQERTWDLTRQHQQAPPQEKEDICGLLAAVPASCDAEGLRRADLAAAYLALTGALEVPTMVGVSASFGRRSFEYIDAGDEEAVANHDNVTAAAYVARYWRRAGYLALRGTFKRAWSAAEGDPDEICQAVPGRDLARCRTAPLGPPQVRTTGVATLEWRRFLGPDLALNPTVSRDFEARVWSLQLPIYFLATDKGLTGGARLGYRSDTRQLTFGVFVGAAALRIVG